MLARGISGSLLAGITGSIVSPGNSEPLGIGVCVGVLLTGLDAGVTT